MKKVLTRLLSRYLSQRKTDLVNKRHIMNIEDIINRVVIIDNVEEEGKAIEEIFKNADIPTDFIKIDQDGDDSELSTFPHQRDLIFADLLLDEDSTNLNTNISRLIGIINRIQPKDAKFYGIVMWTKHSEHFKELITKLGRASFALDESETEEEEEIETTVTLSNPPLFILCLDKTQYLSDGNWNFAQLPNDIKTMLQSSNVAFFSLNWKKTVNDSIHNVINGIYHLSTNYDKQEEELSYIIKELSKNETGEKNDKNLTLGAYQAFDSLLHSELSTLVRKEILPDLSTIENNPYGTDRAFMQTISAKLNTRLFIDDNLLNPHEILPGNIYKILEEENPLNITEEEKIDIPIKNENGNYGKNKSKTYTRINIAIELTPPCDFSNKKIHSRLVGGYIFDMPLGIIKKDKEFEVNTGDKRYAICPIYIPGDKKIKCILFDFRYLWTPREEDIIDEKKYKLWFKAKPGLFADILQKFSSHASRLGINDIHLGK